MQVKQVQTTRLNIRAKHKDFFCLDKHYLCNNNNTYPLEIWRISYMDTGVIFRVIFKYFCKIINI